MASKAFGRLEEVASEGEEKEEIAQLAETIFVR